MSATAVKSASRAQTDPLASLIERLPDPQDRDWYAALVAYVQSLPPQDELVKVAQLFGFLTLLGRELPELLAAEQAKLGELLGQARQALAQEAKTHARYHEQLEERLRQLPAEIAEGVKPEVIAKRMGESFRQQIAATGLQETQARLAAATQDLQQVTRHLEAAVQPLTHRYQNLAGQIEKQATSVEDQATRLARTADTLQRQNAELLGEVHRLQWYYYAALAVVLLLLGGSLGATWEGRNVGDLVISLQGQVAQLQQTLEQRPAVPSSAAPTKTVHKKK